MLPAPLPVRAAATGNGNWVALRSSAARVSPIAVTSEVAPASVIRGAWVSSKGAPPASASDAGKGMSRGVTTPETGEGGVAAAGGLQPDTSAAPANASARFGHDNSPREDIQRLLSGVSVDILRP